MSTEILEKAHWKNGQIPTGPNHSGHTTGKKPASFSKRNQKNRKRPITRRSHSSLNVTTYFNEKILPEFRIDEEKLPEFCFQIAKIITPHPSYEEKEFTPGSHDINTVLRHLIGEFQRLTPKELAVYFEVDNLNITGHWIYECEKCWDYGNLVPFSWLPVLGRKNRKLYQLVLDFLSLCHHKMHIPIWNEWDDEYHAEWVEEAAEEEDDPSEAKSEISYYRRYVWDHYYNKICNKKLSIAKMERNLKSYHPRKEQYRELKTWMTKGIKLIRKKCNYNNYNTPSVVEPPFYDNGEQPPYVYARFIWDSDDKIGTSMKESMTDQVGNFGVVPLTETKKITSQNISKPMKEFGITDQFYDWLSEINLLQEKLYN